MDQIYDVLIIGGGAAATSAAMTLKNRNKTIAVVANKAETGSLYKAEKITNYPGLPPMSGAEMTELFRRQLLETGAHMIEGRAISVLPMEDSFGVAVGSDYYMARSIIITAGITREKLYPGEVPGTHTKGLALLFTQCKPFQLLDSTFIQLLGIIQRGWYVCGERIYLVRAVACRFAPLYQYRKPSRSITSPTFRASTAL